LKPPPLLLLLLLLEELAAKEKGLLLLLAPLLAPLGAFAACAPSFARMPRSTLPPVVLPLVAANDSSSEVEALLPPRAAVMLLSSCEGRGARQGVGCVTPAGPQTAGICPLQLLTS
jgi:hypothetical protein